MFIYYWGVNVSAAEVCLQLKCGWCIGVLGGCGIGRSKRPRSVSSEKIAKLKMV